MDQSQAAHSLRLFLQLSNFPLYSECLDYLLDEHRETLAQLEAAHALLKDCQAELVRNEAAKQTANVAAMKRIAG